uniref:hypothetical protein n=1 Tax=Noviherbaspirillum sp. TaxID=1926288 RepID=UPI002FE381A5
MKKQFQSRTSSGIRCLLAITALSISCGAVAAEANPVAALRAKRALLEQPLRQNQFDQPLVLESVETANGLKGDIYAILDHPITAVSAGLSDPAHWCDIMLLHINTKYCRAAGKASATSLEVNIGKKTPEELSESTRVTFGYRVTAATPDYLEVLLDARDGPLGTSDYRIQLQAASLPNAKTFLHLTYSYSVNFSGRLAMQAYLATVGRGKVGFTVTGSRQDGQPDHIAGVRGLVERNTMRYY